MVTQNILIKNGNILDSKKVPVYVVVAFIVVLTSLCIYGNKQEKKDKSDAKRVRLEL